MRRISPLLLAVGLIVGATPAAARMYGVGPSDIGPLTAFAAAHNCTALVGVEVQDAGQLQCGTRVFTAQEAALLGYNNYAQAIGRFEAQSCRLSALYASTVKCGSAQPALKSDFFPPVKETSKEYVAKRLKATPNLGRCRLVDTPRIDKAEQDSPVYHVHPRAVFACSQPGYDDELMVTAERLQDEAVFRALDENDFPQFSFGLPGFAEPLPVRLPPTLRAYALAQGCAIYGYRLTAPRAAEYAEALAVNGRVTPRPEVNFNAPEFLMCNGDSLINAREAMREARPYATAMDAWLKANSCTNADLAAFDSEKQLRCAGKLTPAGQVRQALSIGESKLFPLRPYVFSDPGSCKAVAGMAVVRQKRTYTYDTVYVCDSRSKVGDRQSFLSVSDVRTEATRIQLRDSGEK